jgi:hypothetical protein
MDIPELEANVEKWCSRLAAHLVRMADAKYKSDAQYQSDCAESDFLSDKFESAKKKLAQAKRKVTKHYGCVQCQMYHNEGDPLYTAHLIFQSKHGVQEGKR